MPVDRFRAEVTSFGRLVKSWARRLDYVGTDFALHPPESTTDAQKKWALPDMFTVDVPGEGGGIVKIPQAIALTRDQFLNRLIGAVKNVSLPTECEYVVVVQGDTRTMVVRLPPKEILKASEANITQNGYSEPQTFYQDLYTDPERPPEEPRVGPFLPNDNADRMRLHANRIGDYSMSNCD